MSEPDRYAVAASTVFDGDECRRDCAVVVEGSNIAAVTPRHELPASIPVKELPDGAWLAPAS